jgi:hypothetical protein
VLFKVRQSSKEGRQTFKSCATTFPTVDRLLGKPVGSLKEVPGFQKFWHIFKEFLHIFSKPWQTFSAAGRTFKRLADLFDGKQLLSSGDRERGGFDGMFLLLLALPRLDLRCSSATIARKRLPQFSKLPFRVHWVRGGGTMGFAVKGGVDKPVRAGSGGNGASERCGDAIFTYA